jgi:hypothetical protein
MLTARTITHPYTISSALLVAVLFCVALYTYFVAASVLDVVVRESSEQRAVAVRSEIASLETELMAAQHAISHRLAAETTFAEDSPKVFLTRGAENVALAPQPDR